MKAQTWFPDHGTGAVTIEPPDATNDHPTVVCHVLVTDTDAAGGLRPQALTMDEAMRLASQLLVAAMENHPGPPDPDTGG